MAMCDMSLYNFILDLLSVKRSHGFELITSAKQFNGLCGVPNAHWDRARTTVQTLS